MFESSIDILYQNIFDICAKALRPHPNHARNLRSTACSAEESVMNSPIDTLDCMFEKKESFDSSLVEQRLNIKNDTDFSIGKRRNTKQKKLWTVIEDQILIKTAEAYKFDWKKIKKRVSKLSKMSKTATFLRNRYKIAKHDLKIKPKIKFTDIEDNLIVQAINEVGYDWTEIAKRVPNRDNISIKNRYYSYLKKKEQI